MGDQAKGSQQCASELRRQGVELIFSVSGDQVLSLYDALDRAGIRIVHARHETAAVYMAEAWAQLKGSPGVCLVTAGPGHLSALAGLAAAQASETPVVLLAGASPAWASGMGAFQELDQTAVAAPLCKAALRVVSAEAMAHSLRSAFDIACSGVPGPVSVSIPVDVQDAPVRNFSDATAHLDESSRAGSTAARQPVGQVYGEADAQVDGALALIQEARSPVIVVRPSLARSEPDLLGVLGKAIPVFIAESPRGPNDPRLGARRKALQSADLIVLIAPPDFAIFRLEGSTSRRRVILVTSQVADLAIAARREERGEMELAGVFHGQERDFLAALCHRLEAGLAPLAEGSIGAEADQLIPREAPSPGALDERGGLHPLQVVQALKRRIAPDDILVLDGGEFGQWVRFGFRDLPNRQVFNGKLGAIGGAIPQALGAGLADRGARVWAFCGDGAFGYYSAEIDTATREGCGIRVVVGNDCRWSAEWHHQVERYGPERAVATSLDWRHLEQVAAGYGGRGWCAETEGELDAALGAMSSLDPDVPACLNVRIQSLPSRLAG